MLAVCLRRLSVILVSVGLDSGLESNYVMLGRGSIKYHFNGILLVLILKINNKGGEIFLVVCITELSQTTPPWLC